MSENQKSLIQLDELSTYDDDAYLYIVSENTDYKVKAGVLKELFFNNHELQIDDINGLALVLSTKANAVHQHQISDIIGLQTILNQLSSSGGGVATPVLGIKTASGIQDNILISVTVTNSKGYWLEGGVINIYTKAEHQTEEEYDFLETTRIKNLIGNGESDRLTHWLYWYPPNDQSTEPGEIFNIKAVLTDEYNNELEVIVEHQFTIQEYPTHELGNGSTGEYSEISSLVAPTPTAYSGFGNVVKTNSNTSIIFVADSGNKDSTGTGQIFRYDLDQGTYVNVDSVYNHATEITGNIAKKMDVAFGSTVLNAPVVVFTGDDNIYYEGEAVYAAFYETGSQTQKLVKRVFAPMDYGLGEVSDIAISDDANKLFVSFRTIDDGSESQRGTVKVAEFTLNSVDKTYDFTAFIKRQDNSEALEDGVFGSALETNSDGTKLLVADKYVFVDGIKLGAVYLYEHSGTEMVYVHTFTPSVFGTGTRKFGGDISASADFTKVAISMYGDDRSVFYYEKDGTTGDWSNGLYVETYEHGDYDEHISIHLSNSGERLFIGTAIGTNAAVKQYDIVNGTLDYRGTIVNLNNTYNEEYFGTCIDSNTNGSVVVISNKHYSHMGSVIESGGVFVFSLS